MIEEIIWLFFLIDSIVANLMVWFSPNWYSKKFKILSKLFPPAKGWAVLYLVLVLWIGIKLSFAGLVPLKFLMYFS